jgi:hypothetical protein
MTSAHTATEPAASATAHVAPAPPPKWPTEGTGEERWDQERPVGDDVEGGYDRCVPLSMNRPWRSLILSSPASGRRRRWPGHDPTPRCNRPSS